MTSDTAAQLAALAHQADTRIRVDAVAACARYCGSRATTAQALSFAAEQIDLLSALEDPLSRDIRRGWEWLADELERLVALAAETAEAEALAAEAVQADGPELEPDDADPIRTVERWRRRSTGALGAIRLPRAARRVSGRPASEA